MPRDRPVVPDRNGAAGRRRCTRGCGVSSSAGVSTDTSWPWAMSASARSRTWNCTPPGTSKEYGQTMPIRTARRRVVGAPARAGRVPRRRLCASRSRRRPSASCASPPAARAMPAPTASTHRCVSVRTRSARGPSAGVSTVRPNSMTIPHGDPARAGDRRQPLVRDDRRRQRRPGGHGERGRARRDARPVAEQVHLDAPPRSGRGPRAAAAEPGPAPQRHDAGRGRRCPRRSAG